jgi:hypothetical protein
MTRALWQLLQEEPSGLTCDECFAVMECYAELLSRGGGDLLPEIKRHLADCPSCQVAHRRALQRLVEKPQCESLSTSDSEAIEMPEKGDRL